jgi:hypothetical protein
MWMMRSLVEGVVVDMASPMGKSWGTVSAARLRNGTDVWTREEALGLGSGCDCQRGAGWKWVD